MQLDVSIFSFMHCAFLVFKKNLFYVKLIKMYFLPNEKQIVSRRLRIPCFCTWGEVGSPILDFFGLPVVPLSLLSCHASSVRH